MSISQIGIFYVHQSDRYCYVLQSVRSFLCMCNSQIGIFNVEREGGREARTMIYLVK